MKIGFIGHGNMAKALAGKWAGRHRIMISGRNAYRTEIVAETLGVLVGTPAEAVAFGDVVVLTTPFGNVFDAIEISGGAAAFAGKIAIDVINPLDPDSLHILRTKERSLTETIGKALPGALLAKAFNMAHASVWADPSLTYDAHPMVALFTADMGAEAIVAELIADIGANPVKLGDNSYAYQLEAAAAIVMKQLESGADHHTILNLVTSEAKPVR